MGDTVFKKFNMGGGGSSQVETMPVASAALVGTIVQYVGATDSSYTNGYFYKCISDGEDPATYSWSRTDVQPSIPDEISASNVIFEDEEDAQTKVTELEQKVDEKFDRKHNTDTLCIVDENGYIIARIDANGVNTVDARIKINGELVSVKSLLASIEEKKLDRVIDDNSLVITDENGYIIARIDASGIHSAQDKDAVACMVLGESYYPTSTPTRDSSGNITHANVMFGTGVAGSLDITYVNNNASQIVVHYGNYTYTIIINRDENGNVSTVSVN